MNVLAKISKALESPAPAATHGLLLDMVKSSGAISKGFTEAQDKDSALFRAELKSAEDNSHTNARRQRKQAVADSVSGKIQPKDVLSSGECIRLASEARQVHRRRASEISRRGCLRAADVLEKSLKYFPTYRDEMLAREKSIFPVDIGRSAVAGMLAELPALIEIKIAKLRNNPAPLVDPAQILNF